MSISRAATGGMLLCRAEPRAVRPPAHLLRVRLLLAPAGGWSVLVPEDKPWRDGPETVTEVLAGWGSAIATGAPWPVLSLWWEAGRTGFTLAGGFRRTVAYAWDAAGHPVGEPDAVRALSARLGLDPVLDLADLERLTRADADPAVDGEARLLALVALLTRAGLTLPPGLAPGESADRLRAAARVAPDVEPLEWSGWRDAVRAELDAADRGPLGPWVRGPRARLLGTAQVAAGAPLLAWAAHRRSPGWATAGAVLLAQGTAALAYDRTRAAGGPWAASP
ncbi:hypothetical protein ABTX85_31325 [Streptomyces sp. NPDC096097]|uniref:hypothetical protein n=1 Tax=Streptomyces sp. NPDC096097 TaxID=3155546 RepID=UPI00332C5598